MLSAQGHREAAGGAEDGDRLPGRGRPHHAAGARAGAPHPVLQPPGRPGHPPGQPHGHPLHSAGRQVLALSPPLHGPSSPQAHTHSFIHSFTRSLIHSRSPGGHQMLPLLASWQGWFHPMGLSVLQESPIPPTACHVCVPALAHFQKLLVKTIWPHGSQSQQAFPALQRGWCCRGRVCGGFGAPGWGLPGLETAVCTLLPQAT